MAQYITSAGKVTNVTPAHGEHFTLEELQKYVGGYIELIYLPHENIMVVNEEGKVNELETNELATIAIAMNGICDYIAGDALVCKFNQIQ